ncbi:PQQ-binding-like beta-propeller repeat protein [Haloferula sp.]|uniref:outer membrane protein assembly factor BamB family protein n=1 Tax=Haloferula sp. TaxID=2497595 RepID=UPI003C71A806
MILFRRIAMIAACFSLALGGLLLINHARLLQPESDGRVLVVEGQEMAALKARLIEEPKNDELRNEIRVLDQRLREELFRRELVARRGAWVLVVGVAVFVVSLQLAHHFAGRPLPRLTATAEDRRKESIKSGRALAVVLLGLLAFAAVLVGGTSPRWERLSLSEGVTVVPNDEVPTEDPWFPTEEELASNWWRFRGPGGLGICSFTGIPTAWNGESGENIVWKTEGGLPGEGSPVVWSDRIFLIGATVKACELSCYDLSTGELKWRESVSSPEGSRADPPSVMDMTGYAASTPVTDGRRVFAIFANGDLAGFSADGKKLWVRNFGTPDNVYGHATSLTMWRNRVIVQFDQGSRGKDGLSSLLAIHAATGDIVWSTKRMVPNSWASPIIIDVEGQSQIVTLSDPWVIAYDPEDGSELWRVDCLKGDVAPSPVFANGLIYVVGEGACLGAIDPKIAAAGSGDPFVWKREGEDFPDMCSLLCDGARVYMLVFGKLQAFDALTGDHLWEHDLEGEFQASPTRADGKFYLLSDEGVMIIGTADREGFAEQGRMELGEDCGASPVFAPAWLILRSRENLYGIGGPDED